MSNQSKRYPQQQNDNENLDLTKQNKVVANQLVANFYCFHRELGKGHPTFLTLFVSWKQNGKLDYIAQPMEESEENVF